MPHSPRWYQAQWLGYPDTMGAEFIQYALGDRLSLLSIRCGKSSGGNKPPKSKIQRRLEGLSFIKKSVGKSFTLRN